MVDIQFDRHSLIIEGQRTFIRSGAMHYFRLPHPDLWWDRLSKLKASGYNTVDLYFSWDFHSPAPGQYDFTGIRNVNQLLEMVTAVGLYLIARPGPYINAETTRGGLPGWLLTEPDVIIRNRMDGEFQYSPRYMHYVRQWMDQILPFIKACPNLLMIQIENEYSTVEMEPDYMTELLKIVRDHGITAPSMHNDFYAAGLYEDIVDIYAVDNYSVTSFDLNWRTFPGIFSVMDHLEESIREAFCPNRPLMMAELQAGWFAGWKGVPYEVIHKALGREHIGMITRSFLGQGGTIYNHYKAVGGTNWNHLGATDAFTSYDFSAPISESGIPTKRLFEAKRINLLLETFDLTQTERVNPAEIGLTDSHTLYGVRKSVSQAGAYWIFTRNLTETTQCFDVKPGVAIETQPYHAQMIPYQFTLQNGWLLEALNVEPLCQTPHCLILPASQKVTMDIQIPVPNLIIQGDTQIKHTILDTNRYRFELESPLKPDEMVTVQLCDYSIHFLGGDLADRLWLLENDQLWVGPDMVRAQTEAYVSHARPIGKIQTDGTFASVSAPELTSIMLPELTDWQLLPEVFPSQLPSDRFKSISRSGSDMDQNGFYEGAVWYQYEFTGKPKCLTIHAQHIWAILLNGEVLIQNHTFHVHPETGGTEDSVTIQLPQEHLKTDGPNTLHIFVESLGHHKGFYDDMREPRGILKLKLDNDEIQLTGKIAPAALDPFSVNPKEAALETVPILHAVTAFHLEVSKNTQVPIGLKLDLDVERVNITLNGVLIGKYWQSCKNQTVFYLPEGILNQEGINHLGLTLINFLPPLTVANPFPKSYGKVCLLPLREFSKLFENFDDMS